MAPTALERASDRKPVSASTSAGLALDDFLDAPAKTPRGSKNTGPKATAFELALIDAERRAKSGEWDDAKPSTFVGLYALCHRMTYRCLPEELTVDLEFRLATKLVSSFLANEFSGNATHLAAMVRWAWEREKGRAKWAEENSITRNRLRWRFTFSKALLTDYKVASQQTNRRARA